MKEEEEEETEEELECRGSEETPPTGRWWCRTVGRGTLGCRVEQGWVGRVSCPFPSVTPGPRDVTSCTSLSLTHPSPTDQVYLTRLVVGVRSVKDRWDPSKPSTTTG